MRIDDECFTPVEYSPYGSGGSFSERCSGRDGPSPVFTPHAPSGLLDPHVGSALDVASNVFTPDKIIIPKTHILVETVRVPLQPTPPELPTPLVSNDKVVAPPQTLPSMPPQTRNAPAPITVTLEHACRPVALVHPPAQPVLSPPSVVTRSQAAEVVCNPSQYIHPIPKSLAPASNDVPTAGHTTPRPIQIARPTSRPSAVPVRRGPVPAGSVPSPNRIRLPPEHARSQVGAGHTSTLVSYASLASRIPPIRSTPVGSAPGPEVSRRIKSHPRKTVTTVGQRRSVVMPAPPVTQPTAPPPELLGSIDVVPGPVLRSTTQRITTRIRTRDLVNRVKPLPIDTPSEYSIE